MLDTVEYALACLGTRYVLSVCKPCSLLGKMLFDFMADDLRELAKHLAVQHLDH